MDYQVKRVNENELRKAFKKALKDSSADELVALLNHINWSIESNTQYELVKRGEQSDGVNTIANDLRSTINKIYFIPF